MIRFVFRVGVLVVAFSVVGCAPVTPSQHLSIPVRVPGFGLTPVNNSVVRITAAGCGMIEVGSGWVAGAHTIVTNRHVVDTLTKIRAALWDRTPVTVTNTRIVPAPGADIAILTTKQTLTRPLPISIPRVGMHVNTTGYPNGGPLTRHTGTITALSDTGMNVDVWSTNGSSGSPITTSTSQVVGMIWGYDPTHQSVAVTGTQLRAVLHDTNRTVPNTACNPLQ